MQQLAYRLSPAYAYGFVRVHRGELVNLTQVRRVERSQAASLTLHLEDGQSVRVSRRQARALRHRLAF
jgi:DNA-binding LytR/AlgR family response regulator